MDGCRKQEHTILHCGKIEKKNYARGKGCHGSGQGGAGSNYSNQTPLSELQVVETKNKNEATK